MDLPTANYSRNNNEDDDGVVSNSDDSSCSSDDLIVHHRPAAATTYKGIGPTLLQDEALHDVTLLASDGVPVGSVRAVLASRSNVFRSLLYGNFREAHQDVVPMAGYNGKVLQAVVEYIHTDTAELSLLKVVDYPIHGVLKEMMEREVPESLLTTNNNSDHNDDEEEEEVELDTDEEDDEYNEDLAYEFAELEDSVFDESEYLAFDATELEDLMQQKEASYFEPEDVLTLVSLLDAANYFELPGLATKIFPAMELIIMGQGSLSFLLLEHCVKDSSLLSPKYLHLCLHAVRYKRTIAGITPISKTTVESVVKLLSAQTMEWILKDPYTRLTEAELFELLLAWVDGDNSTNCTEEEGEGRESTTTSRQKEGSKLVKYINLEHIPPSKLNSLVKPSNLVSKEDLDKIFQNQLMEVESTLSVPFGKPRCDPVWDVDGEKTATATDGSAAVAPSRVIKSAKEEKLTKLKWRPLTTGVFEWIISFNKPKVFTFLNTVPFHMGIQRAAVDERFDGPNSWSISELGAVHCQGVRTDNIDALMREVTAKLNLQADQPGNGTFQVSLNGGRSWHLVAWDLLSVLAQHPKDGFIPFVQLPKSLPTTVTEKVVEAALMGFEELSGISD